MNNLRTKAINDGIFIRLSFLDDTLREKSEKENDMMQIMKNAKFRMLMFTLILIALLALCAAVFSVFPDGDTFQRIESFYAEPDNSLQAVYIGSSNCYAFWNPMIAWNNYGITVYPYATGNMPFGATEYVIREVRKTQPNAKIIVNVNGVEADDLGPNDIHYLLHYMPESENKDKLMEYLSGLMDYDEYDQLEFEYPLIRMRRMPLTISRYILANGLREELNGLKGANTAEHYYSRIKDITEEYIQTHESAELPEYLKEATEKLLDYCDEERIDVLFVTVPRAEDDENSLARINTMNEMISDRGYTVLTLTEEADVLKLDLSQDFYNSKHTNLHGSIKFTKYLSEYLIKEYGLESLNGKKGYDSWNDGWNAYEKEISKYALPIEIKNAHRDTALKCPEELSAQPGRRGTKIQWSASEGADGYAVFRKDGPEEPWKEICAFQSENAYVDEVIVTSSDCYYAIVPVRKNGDEVFYGNYQYNGVKAMA